MSNSSVYRILVVDDKQEQLEELEHDLRIELGDFGEIAIEVRDSFEAAEQELRSQVSQYDVVILDVMMGDPNDDAFERERGVELYERLRDIRWVPIVFYTGLPSSCEGLEAPPLVTVVGKDEPDVLYDRVRAALDSGAAQMARDLVSKLDRQIRSFLGHHVAPSWEQYSELKGEGIERVLVGRLAAFMREWDVPADGTAYRPIGHAAVPASYYLMPPLKDAGLRAGSILRESVTGDNGSNDQESWWIVLTPTCDLFTNEAQSRSPKATRVLLSRLIEPREHPKLKAFVDEGRGRGDARRILSGHIEESRWYYLPAFLSIPHLLVDLEHLRTEPHDHIREPVWTRVADLDTPFMEVLLARQSHWRGRIGKPDLDWNVQLDSLKGNP
ncbi:CheY-like chemotaxis protein [Paenarthrobacter nicotinovorans]|uniref:CheY-like chemotaxis protein n=1 Tax=Paenarthrobacter nicotinovorans TaxID=29320 RepID=A0ABT9TPQ6_PAENI|nr:response regulator [Paenarthrobacter nicotinovorans]MDQ0103365.1 CheY-like chemotaxis protein [Paenarthrobacter nicotinovorans]GAT86578.1 hypothetical protein CVCC1112_1237 [Paenarthrobacter nicotinovorans]